MASITIRNLGDSLKRRLRIRAAEHGRSMQEETREIQCPAVGASMPPKNLAAAIRSRVEASGGAGRDEVKQASRELRAAIDARLAECERF